MISPFTLQVWILFFLTFISQAFPSLLDLFLSSNMALFSLQNVSISKEDEKKSFFFQTIYEKFLKRGPKKTVFAWLERAVSSKSIENKKRSKWEGFPFFSKIKKNIHYIYRDSYILVFFIVFLFSGSLKHPLCWLSHPSLT